MKNLLPLEILLNQLMELYHQILDNQKKQLKISPENKLAIERIAREIRAISQVTDQEISRHGLDPEMINKTILGSKKTLPSDVQKLLEKSQYLKSQIYGCKNVLKEIIKKQKKEKTEKNSRILAEKRQSKFKKVGGKKGWIPL